MIEDRLVMTAGGSRDHSLIAVNITIALSNQLAGKPCLPFSSDFLLEANGRNRYYPDVTVACGETRDFTDRPVLVVEVLSPSTQREDLGPKLVAAQPTPRDNNHLMGNAFSGFLLNPPSEIKLENLEERQRRYSIQ
jgi:hypothetical protein